jgi:hypothetical protein
MYHHIPCQKYHWCSYVLLASLPSMLELDELDCCAHHLCSLVNPSLRTFTVSSKPSVFPSCALYPSFFSFSSKVTLKSLFMLTSDFICLHIIFRQNSMSKHHERCSRLDESTNKCTGDEYNRLINEIVTIWDISSKTATQPREELSWAIRFHLTAGTSLIRRAL